MYGAELVLFTHCCLKKQNRLCSFPYKYCGVRINIYCLNDDSWTGLYELNLFCFSHLFIYLCGFVTSFCSLYYQYMCLLLY